MVNTYKYGPNFIYYVNTFLFESIEKWTTTNDNLLSYSLIAMYPFTSPIIDVRITNCVIHALTDNGIETYTHRIGHKLFSNPYEYGLQDDPFHIEVLGGYKKIDI